MIPNALTHPMRNASLRHRSHACVDVGGGKGNCQASYDRRGGFGKRRGWSHRDRRRLKEPEADGRRLLRTGFASTDRGNGGQTGHRRIVAVSLRRNPSPGGLECEVGHCLTAEKRKATSVE